MENVVKRAENTPIVTLCFEDISSHVYNIHMERCPYAQNLSKSSGMQVLLSIEKTFIYFTYYKITK